MPLRHRTLLAALRLMPRNLVSRGAGRVAAWRWPRFLRRRVVTAFGRTFGVDFSEIDQPLDTFPSIQSFFIRRLRPGVRPIDVQPRSLVAPCDGAWGEAGAIAGGLLMQLKGRPYSLAQLLGDAEEAERFEGGTFATFYLSPKDYHRFHTPCAAEVTAARYLPGSLWPVNAIGLGGIDGLFAENERVCAFMQAVVDNQPTGGELCIVAVGATMVGKVWVEFDDLTTNVSRASGPHAAVVSRAYEPAIAFDKGAEWGRFEFGSTLVLVATPGTLELDIQAPDTALRLGQRIGSLKASSAGNT